LEEICTGKFQYISTQHEEENRKKVGGDDDCEPAATFQHPQQFSNALFLICVEMGKSHTLALYAKSPPPKVPQMMMMMMMITDSIAVLLESLLIAVQILR
jgi:hypothetical protein